MSRPHDDGHRANGARQEQTQNNHLHFANGGAVSKALVDRESLLASLNYNAAEPSIRAVGDILREIGGRP